jgi:hypothetical protein
MRSTSRFFETFESLNQSKKLRNCICIPISLPENDYVNTFQRQRTIVGDGFCGVCVVSKKSRKIILLSLLKDVGSSGTEASRLEHFIHVDTAKLRGV